MRPLFARYSIVQHTHTHTRSPLMRAARRSISRYGIGSKITRLLTQKLSFCLDVYNKQRSRLKARRHKALSWRAKANRASKLFPSPEDGDSPGYPIIVDYRGELRASALPVDNRFIEARLAAGNVSGKIKWRNRRTAGLWRASSSGRATGHFAGDWKFPGITVAIVVLVADLRNRSTATATGSTCPIGGLDAPNDLTFHRSRKRVARRRVPYPFLNATSS